MNNKKLVSLMVVGMMALSSLTACSETDTQETSTENAVESTADSTVLAERGYLYGTLDLSYADYYYGELSNVEAEEVEMSVAGQYDAENKVTAAGYREEGMYDAVTSATTTKSKLFEAAFTEDTDTGVNIIGPSNVNVAISKALYDDVQEAIENKTECRNPLIELVQNMENVSDIEPVEYKVINSDGTISKTI